jgi:carbamoyltransferase
VSVNIIGVSALFHDAACCLLVDGKIAAAAEEERFTRLKADPRMPQLAFRYCLEDAGLRISDIDCVAYYEDPVKKLARQLWSGVLGDKPDITGAYHPTRVEQQIRQLLGFEGEIRYYDHHLSHAASSFFFSGFEDAAILTVDGVGEWATTTYGIGRQDGIKIFEEVQFPDSLGLLYSTITSYLGFEVNEGEYKVMGLAPYGRPLYMEQLHRLVHQAAGGQYQLDMKYFGFLKGTCMYTGELSSLFERPPRKQDEPIEQFHKDLAKSLQVALEEILLSLAKYLFQKTGIPNLCMAGGVALNCVANGNILRKGPFNRLFVQPAANDAGGALGAAALAHVDITHDCTSFRRLEQVYLGPGYSSGKVQQLLQATSLKYEDHRKDSGGMLRGAAQRLATGKVIGWMQGRMEFGPRSLGARSILADPRNPDMRDRINAMVKKREGFRPFAPAILDWATHKHFDLDHPSPFMLETCDVISDLDLPAITHVDRSARVQTVHADTNPRFYDLLTEFNNLTGCPILLNTSFNIKGEPIVCSPADALRCFITTNIDCLVLEDFLIDREDNDMALLELILSNDATNGSPAISHDVYTFI